MHDINFIRENPIEFDNLIKTRGSKPCSSKILKIGKEAFYRQLEMDLDSAYRYTSEVMAENMMAADAREGIDAFMQKRDPVWKGA